MKPLPATVIVCEAEPATRLAGVMDAMLGVGFGEGFEEPPEEGGWGVLVEEVGFEPPQPERNSKQPTDESTSREMRRTKPSRGNHTIPGSSAAQVAYRLRLFLSLGRA
jgi:hypothetical protein